MKRALSYFLCIIVSIYCILMPPLLLPVYAGEIWQDFPITTLVNLLKCVSVAGKYGDGSLQMSNAIDAYWDYGGLMNNWVRDKVFPFSHDYNGDSAIDLTNLPPDAPISYDIKNDLIEFKADFLKELQTELDNSVAALEHCYLITPSRSYNYSDYIRLFSECYNKLPNDAILSFQEFFKNYDHLLTGRVKSSDNAFECTFFTSDDSILYISSDGLISCLAPDGTDKKLIMFNCKTNEYSNTRRFIFSIIKSLGLPSCFWGTPVRLFYTKADALLSLSEGRTYTVNLLNVTNNNSLYLPRQYVINNNFNEFKNYNISGGSDSEIQNQINLTIRDILDDINLNFTDGEEPVNPTPTLVPGQPTPTPDFGDGSLTPTPPPFTDGTQSFDLLKKIEDWLHKIFDWLTDYGSSHSELDQLLENYFSSAPERFDQLIEILESIVSGVPPDDENNKYDFTALSEFLTELWNESDQKFEDMIDLLEENNKYQKKLVNSLNEIKALLVVDTVMDVFKDRSQETANKAKQKFPTSIPWDIAMIVNAMCAEPEAPVIRVPIKVESLNINEEIVIDLSTGEWEKLAKTCRSLLSILFVLYLIHLTRELFFKGDD